MLHAALIATLRTLTSRYFLALLLGSLAATGIAYLIFMYGTLGLLQQTSFVHRVWLDAVLDWFAGVGAGILAWFLFPAVMPMVANLFQERIAARIEKHEYGLAPLPGLPFWSEFFYSVRFLFLYLFINLLCLPFYFSVFLFPLVYYPLNAFLLGREFFEMCAARHVGRKEARRLRKSQRFTVMAAGGVILVLANIPFAALFTPFVGVALMVHLYHSITTKPT